jgi:hypothetical protein
VAVALVSLKTLDARQRIHGFQLIEPSIGMQGTSVFEFIGNFLRQFHGKTQRCR